MRAVIDWSYGLLTADEQRFLRQLAIFAGSFTVQAAASVAGDPVQPRVDTIDLLAGLVAKSLVVADITGAEPRFRLLDTTRACALEKLGEGGELEAAARSHAEFYRDLLELTATNEAAVAEWSTSRGPDRQYSGGVGVGLLAGGDQSIGV